MKRALLAVLILTGLAFPQASDRRIPGSNGFVALTATCANANTTCDSATTVFGPNGDVIGPQTIEVNTQGYGLAVVYVSGVSNGVGSTLNFEFSDDGGTSWYANICTRTDANIQEGSEAVPTTTFRAWDCGVGAATRFRVRQSAISSGAIQSAITLTAGLVEPAPTVAIANTPGATDPCQNPGLLKSSAFVNITTATTTALVAVSGTTAVYVCQITAELSNSTTASTILFEQGTGATCAGAPTALTATYANATTVATVSSVPIVIGGGSAMAFKTAASNGLCAVTTVGTTPTIAVTVTFVQQ